MVVRGLVSVVLPRPVAARSTAFMSKLSGSGVVIRSFLSVGLEWKGPHFQTGALAIAAPFNGMLRAAAYPTPPFLPFFEEAAPRPGDAWP